MELADHLHAFDVLLPQADGEFIRHQLAAAGVFPEDPAHLALQIERAEDIAAGAVIKAGDGAEDLALSAFAGARGAEEEDGFIAHHLILPSKRC